MEQKNWQQYGLRRQIIESWQEMDLAATQDTRVLKTRLAVRMFMALIFTRILSSRAGEASA
jgi:hypothetical protein